MNQTISKLMVIAWSWNDRGNIDGQIPADKPFDFFTVKDEPGCLLMRIDPGHKPNAIYDDDPGVDAAEESIRFIKKEIERIGKNAKIQVYLHRAHKYKRIAHQEELAAWGKERGINLECFLFQHHDSCLYISDSNKYGLLGLNGRWGDRIFDGINYQALLKGHINPLHYNFIWNFHEYKLGQEFYDLYENIQKICLPLAWLKDVHMADFRWQLDDLRQQIAVLENKDETIKYVYQNWPEVSENYVDLLSNHLLPLRKTLDIGVPDTNMLRQVREKFVQLFNCLPTSRIYVNA